MISQFLASVNVKNGSEIWLGGRQMDFHNFNWGDGSLFNYSYWEQGEPSFPAEKCIEMSWRNGRWNDINCRLKRAVLCERQISSRQMMKPILYQPTTCLDSNCSSSSGSSVTSMASNGATPTISLANNNTNESNFSQVSSAIDQQLLEQTNRTGAGSLNNSTTTSSDGVNFMLPPDDRPIKVITSIMNQQQQQQQQLHQNLPPELALPTSASVTVDPASNETTHVTTNSTTSWPATSSSSSSNSTNRQQPNETAVATEINTSQQNGTTFIHYNLPPPERSFEVDQQHQIPVGSTDSILSSKNDNSLVEQVKQPNFANGSHENTTSSKGIVDTTLSTLI
jgi:hypothetical protein